VKDDIYDESTWDHSLWSVSRTAVTDARGEFAFAPLPPGVHRVVPVEQDRDPLEGGTVRPLPAPFIWRKVTLKDGETPAPMEVRALPSVVVEAPIRDSGGRTRAGFPFFLSGSLDLDRKDRPRTGPLGLPERIGEDGGPEWRSQTWSDANGRIALRAPHGLQSVILNLSDFNHADHAQRYRIGQGAPLRRGPIAVLGSLNRDVRDIEIITYKSPSVLVRVVAADGSRIKGARVAADYGGPRGPDAEPTSPEALAASEYDGLDFLEQDDGRFRAMWLLPDETVTVTASADGYRPRSATLKQAEGAVKELDLVLEKR
jgi:hypothetical protein